MEQDRGVCFEEYLVGLCQGYEEIGPSRENAQSRNKWRKRIWGEAGQPANPRSPRKNGHENGIYVCVTIGSDDH